MTKALAGPFDLGPQDDGAIVVRIPSDWHLMLTRKALEKQVKNSGAAEGTISALADGDDPFLDNVQRGLQDLVKLIAGARAPDKQLSGTPIGEALKAAVTQDPATSEQVSGMDDGVRWLDSVPTPRPQIGQMLRWPGGHVTSVGGVKGYDDERGAFVVDDVEGGEAMVLAHNAGDGTPEWRVFNRVLDATAYPDGYEPAFPDPAHDQVGAAADELQAGAATSGSDLTDFPDSTDDADDSSDASNRPLGDAEDRAAVEREDEAVRTGAVADTPATSQRERNARQAGVKRGPSTTSKTAAKKTGTTGKPGGKKKR